jgi:hypothetical protein
MREQREEALDARACAAQVLGGGRVVERLARGDQQLLVGLDLDLATASARLNAADAQRAAVANGLGEARPPAAGGLGADLGDVALGQVTMPWSSSIRKSRLSSMSPLAGASGTGARTITERSSSSSRTGPVP